MDNLPKAPVNPLQDMLMSMPALPDIIKSAMPVVLPQMQYMEGPLAMIFGNFKRARLAEATKLEAEIADNSNKALQSKLNAIISVITFSSRIDCALTEYGHCKEMFKLQEDEKRMDIFIKQSQATQAGFEAKMSELDFRVRENQFKKMMEE